MFKGFGRGWFAIGLIVGIGITLIFAIWFGEPFYEVKAADSNTKPERNYDQQGYGPIPPAFIRTQDTLAQWLMTFFAIAATGVSVWAVALLSKTLDATVDAANAAQSAVQITQKTGEAQTRAYLYVEGMRVVPKHSDTRWICKMKVAVLGTSPAANLRYIYYASNNTDPNYVRYTLNNPAPERHEYSGGINP